MNRTLIFQLFLFCFVDGIWSQVFFGGQYQIDIYKPYTQEAKAYIDKYNNVTSSTLDIYSFYLKSLNYRNKIGLGISYKKINHSVNNRIEIIEVVELSNVNGNPIDTFLINVNADLISKSNNFGLNFHYVFVLYEKVKYRGDLGVNSELFLFEKSEGKYLFEKNSQLEALNSINYRYFTRKNTYFSMKNGFFLSGVNISAYYRQVFQLHENFSLAARISLGTNLYSDWDQFKKYAWLGLGLEMGFGKVKGKKDKVKEID